jgi:hypothetical protein
MDFTGRPMKGFVLIGPEGTASDHELKFWLNRALKYNKTVKSSGRKK